ncbi:MAG: hypothetical protein J7J76_02980 [Candidatus Latescibacteria bacterium]|nr:hypothetical protein [Candidatus Latescibacterota bacterium]
MTMFDDSAVLVTAGEASFGRDFFIMAKRFQRYELPDCGPSLLRQPGVVTIEEWSLPMLTLHGRRSVVTREGRPLG